MVSLRAAARERSRICETAVSGPAESAKVAKTPAQRDFSAPGRARSQQLSQNQTQVERSHMNQLPLQNIFLSAQVAAPHPARP